MSSRPATGESGPSLSSDSLLFFHWTETIDVMGVSEVQIFYPAPVEVEMVYPDGVLFPTWVVVKMVHTTL